LTSVEIDILKKYQAFETYSKFYNDEKNIQILNAIFDKAPEIPNTIYVYRCRSSTEKFISTSLSFEIAKNFCSASNNFEKIVYILIPEGSRVLPFLNGYTGMIKYNEFEILLPSTGKIIPTKHYKSKKISWNKSIDIPIYVFIDEKYNIDKAYNTEIPSNILIPDKPAFNENKPNSELVSIPPIKKKWYEWFLELLKKVKEPKLHSGGMKKKIHKKHNTKKKQKQKKNKRTKSKN
jgi:hypothetical protein